jgi:hypothetical protein
VKVIREICRTGEILLDIIVDGFGAFGVLEVS